MYYIPMKNMIETFKGPTVKIAATISILAAGAACDRIQSSPQVLPQAKSADPHTQAAIENLATEFARRCLEAGQAADLSSLVKEKNALSPEIQKTVKMKCREVSDYTDHVALVTIDGQTFSTRRSPEAKDAVAKKGSIPNERIEWIRTVSD